MNNGLDMPRVRRPELAADAQRRNLEQLARLGGDLRASRPRRRLSQRELARLTGLSQSTISLLERGRGGSLSLDTWQRVALALGRPLRVDLAADPRSEPADAGHLAIQELVLRLSRAAGYTGSFELATRPADPGRSADVALRDDRRRRFVLVECWNTIGDIGAAARSFERKLAEAQRLAVAIGGDRPHRVAGCWVVRATARNRTLLARYAEVFAARFPGSSVAWVRTLATGTEPPDQPGLAWCDAARTRLFAWRRRG